MLGFRNNKLLFIMKGGNNEQLTEELSITDYII